MNYQDSYTILDLAEAIAALTAAGYKDITEETNTHNKRNDYAVFEDPSGVGVHYCESEADVMDMMEWAV